MRAVRTERGVEQRACPFEKLLTRLDRAVRNRQHIAEAHARRGRPDLGESGERTQRGVRALAVLHTWSVVGSDQLAGRASQVVVVGRGETALHAAEVFVEGGPRDVRPGGQVGEACIGKALRVDQLDKRDTKARTLALGDQLTRQPHARSKLARNRGPRAAVWLSSWHFSSPVHR